MYFKPAVATSLGQALYPCAISDEVWLDTFDFTFFIYVKIVMIIVCRVRQAGVIINNLCKVIQ